MTLAHTICLRLPHVLRRRDAARLHLRPACPPPPSRLRFSCAAFRVSNRKIGGAQCATLCSANPASLLTGRFLGVGPHIWWNTMCRNVFHQFCGRESVPRHANKQARMVEHNGAHCVPPTGWFSHVLRPGCLSASLVEHEGPHCVPFFLRSRTRIAAREKTSKIG